MKTRVLQSLFVFSMLSSCEDSEQAPFDSPTVSRKLSREAPKLPRDPQSLRALLANLDPQELTKSTPQIDQLVTNDPANAEHYLRYFAEALAANNPLEALRFLSDRDVFHSSSTQILSELASFWIAEDPEMLEDLLRSASQDPNERLADHLIQASMTFQEESGKITNLLVFLDSVEDPKLSAKGLDALVAQERQISEESFASLKTAYEARIEDPDFQIHLPALGEALARRQPEAVKEFADKMPGGDHSHVYAERAMAELARSHPEVATRWLSEDQALTSFFKPSPEAQANIEKSLAEGGPNAEYEQEMLRINQEIRYDQVLSRFIFALSENHPEDALESVKVLHDPELRAEIEATLRARMEPEE